MAAFVGKYKFDRNENLDEYIKKMGKLLLKKELQNSQLILCNQICH